MAELVAACRVIPVSLPVQINIEPGSAQRRHQVPATDPVGRWRARLGTVKDIAELADDPISTHNRFDQAAAVATIKNDIRISSDRT